MGKWKVKQIKGEFFAESVKEYPSRDGMKPILFRDFNNEILPLGKDEVWATEWVNTRNEIENIL